MAANLWWIFIFFDGILFIGATLTIVYMAVFSVSALFYKTHDVPKAKRQNRFIILIPSYKDDGKIINTVKSILSQTYPQRLFDVTVISDHQSEMTNMRLAQYTITLLTPNFEKSSRVKSLQYAILNLPAFKIYDVVLVLNSNSIVEPEFLDKLNNAYEAAGTWAIVTHRLAHNRNSSSSRLSTIFEEINNSIFRRGHLTFGLSSALADSGVAYDFSWYKKNIMKVRGYSEDKELEALLVRQQVYVDYFDNLYVFCENKSEVRDFNRQRYMWILEQLQMAFKNIRFLPSAVFNRQYDWMDKIIQWLLIPRSILFAIVFVMCITLPFIYFSMAIKWWIVTLLWGFFLAFATPNELVDKNWDKDFIAIPVYMFKTFFRKIKAKLTK